MLEKTFSTFHASNAGLQTYLCVQGFKRYSDLNALLLVAEKNNEVLMKNHLARPTGSMALPKANAISHNDAKNFRHTRGRGRGNGRGRFDKNRFNNPFKWNNNYNGRGCGSGRGRDRSQRVNNYHNLQNENQLYKFQNEVGTSQLNDSSCFRCGSKNHWSKACRTPSHLCKLYQASLKEKEK
ncbi:hypothetical protein E3N88_42219 [Mikania micrantha]|uniref:CCHC-type domain-containing protein n=1 Tax=Mikania micrantha TaxID=192012 RepID=A0A5N6LIF2_9ASTR|nr:hypothetical protein E3N88_42219 [Mikania micrantha]